MTTKPAKILRMIEFSCTRSTPISKRKQYRLKFNTMIRIWPRSHGDSFGARWIPKDLKFFQYVDTGGLQTLFGLFDVKPVILEFRRCKVTEHVNFESQFEVGSGGSVSFGPKIYPSITVCIWLNYTVVWVNLPRPTIKFIDCII